MSDFATALHRIHDHGDSLLAEATGMLRQLVADTCDALGAAEGSILVPVEGRNELRFFVSVNPVLESSGLSVPIDESISGYVFTTRQAMAKIQPETAGASKVDEVARAKTSYLLAVPIVDDERVYGVATFVNRTDDRAETPFSVEELRTAQAYGEIYATAMKLHRRIDFSTRMVKMELSAHASQFGVSTLPEPSPEVLAALRHQLPALLAERASSLPAPEKELLYRIGELIGEFAESGGHSDAHDL